MARDRANINTNIWTDQDWRDLTRDEQWLYTLLMTHPSLTYAGVADWRTARLSAMAASTSKEDIERAAKGLQEARFVFVDDDTEEILVRSFLRHDGLLKQPKLSISMVNAFGSVASKPIRQVIVHELRRLNGEYPEWGAFSQEKVQALLKLEGKDMGEFTHSFTPAVTPASTPTGGQADPLPTSTATTTATSTVVEGSGEGRKKPKRPLPASWQPNETHREYASAERINLDFQAERFRTHAEANDRRIVNWDAAFKNWLLKAEKSTFTGASPWDMRGKHD